MRKNRTLAPDDHRHGTNNGYVNLGCRCDPCRQANSVYQTKLRRAKGIKTPAEAHEPMKSHGWSRYKRGGCRCDICRAAAAAQKRRQRANNAEHYREYERERRALRKAAA